MPTQKNILCLSGSNRAGSATIRLLEALADLHPSWTFSRYDRLGHLLLFEPKYDQYPRHAEIVNWREAVAAADALIIATPEYLHNLPALLKNALEWLTTSGELSDKRVLPLTLTPHEPRGEKAMQSLLWSLQALTANIVTHLALYHADIQYDAEGRLLESDGVSILREAIGLL